MKITRILACELVLILASLFIFRSVWALLDQYFGDSYLIEFLVVGIILTILALVLLNHEVECEIREMKK